MTKPVRNILAVLVAFFLGSVAGDAAAYSLFDSPLGPPPQHSLAVLNFQTESNDTVPWDFYIKALRIDPNNRLAKHKIKFVE